MSSIQLALLAGLILAVVFEYTPKLRQKYNALDDTYQQLIMLGMLAVAALVAFGVSCAGLHIPGIDTSSLTCDQHGILGLIDSFIAALVVNQGAHRILPKFGA